MKKWFLVLGLLVGMVGVGFADDVGDRFSGGQIGTAINNQITISSATNWNRNCLGSLSGGGNVQYQISVLDGGTTIYNVIGSTWTTTEATFPRPAELCGSPGKYLMILLQKRASSGTLYDSSLSYTGFVREGR